MASSPTSSTGSVRRDDVPHAAAARQCRQPAERQDALVQTRFQPRLTDDVVAIAECVDPKRQLGLALGAAARCACPPAAQLSRSNRLKDSVSSTLGFPPSPESALDGVGRYLTVPTPRVANLDFDPVQFDRPHRRIDGGAEIKGLLKNRRKFGCGRIIGGFHDGGHCGRRSGAFRAQVALTLNSAPVMTMPAKPGAGTGGIGLANDTDRQRAAFPHPPGGQLHRQRDAARQHRSLDLEGADQTAGHDLGIDRLDTLPDAGGVAIAMVPFWIVSRSS